MTTPLSISIRRPDDWHVHLRDGALLAGVAPHTARQFARAIVMPNLSPPMTDVAGVSAYRDRIMAALPEGSDFTPLMTLYLTDHTDPDEVERGHSQGVFVAPCGYVHHGGYTCELFDYFAWSAYWLHATTIRRQICHLIAEPTDLDKDRYMTPS